MNDTDNLDDWLIDKVAQPFTDFVAKWTPITGLHIAQFLLIGAGFAIGAGDILNTIWDFNIRSPIYLLFKPLDLIFGLAISTYAFALAYDIKKKISNQEGRVTNTASADRLKQKGIRAIGLLIIFMFTFTIAFSLGIHNPNNAYLVTISYWISLSGSILLTTGLYLNACSQPPRKEKKAYRTNFAFGGA